MKHKLWAQFI